jgi:hypothetical protein
VDRRIEGDEADPFHGFGFYQWTNLGHGSGLSLSFRSAKQTAMVHCWTRQGPVEITSLSHSAVNVTEYGTKARGTK